MTGLEIGLLLIGALLVEASFFMTKKFSDSDIDELQKMSESQIKVILEKQLKEADGVIEAAIDSKMDQKMEELDVRSDKETNNKIKQISEYSDSVLDSMNKSHDEIMFMYDMLNEKQEKTTELTKNLQAMESEIRMLKDAIEKKVEELQELNVPVVLPEETISEEEPSILPEVEDTIPRAFAEHVQTEENPNQKNDNSAILELHKMGYSEIEIAKKLGRGLGEVKLVLGLFMRNEG
jgi:chromosome segregation ATPase